MKAILYSAIAIAVIAVGANLFLDQFGFSSAEKTSGQSVRLEKGD